MRCLLCACRLGGWHKWHQAENCCFAVAPSTWFPQTKGPRGSPCNIAFPRTSGCNRTFCSLAPLAGSLNIGAITFLFRGFLHFPVGLQRWRLFQRKAPVNFNFRTGHPVTCALCLPFSEWESAHSWLVWQIEWANRSLFPRVLGGAGVDSTCSLSDRSTGEQSSAQKQSHPSRCFTIVPKTNLRVV